MVADSYTRIPYHDGNVKMPTVHNMGESHKYKRVETNSNSNEVQIQVKVYVVRNQVRGLGVWSGTREVPLNGYC